MRDSSHRAFTIIELLVVVSIIALLIGILLPAIGKAQEQAKYTKSVANLRQLGTAAVTYAAEWNDRQLTTIDDNIGGKYGDDWNEAIMAYGDQVGYEHPWALVGFGRNPDTGGPVVYGFPPIPGGQGGYEPIVMTPGSVDYTGSPDTRFGAFRVPNFRAFSQYLNGRFYDPVFYAPKDTSVIATVEKYFDHPDEYVRASQYGETGVKWSSYCFSPAAMFNPTVLTYNKGDAKFFKNPWTLLHSGFKSPTMSQAQHPNLKTHILEHHWLQQRKFECNTFFSGSTYGGCEPYYFNHAFASSPATLFYDGHVGQIGQERQMKDNARVAKQTETPSNESDGLWSVDTPLQGSYEEPNGGYWARAGLDWTHTSYHILTIDGIRGRDITQQ